MRTKTWELTIQKEKKIRAAGASEGGGDKWRLKWGTEGGMERKGMEIDPETNQNLLLPKGHSG